MNQEQNNTSSLKEKLQTYLSIGLASFFVISSAILVFFLLFRFDEIASFIFHIIGILKPIICGFVIAYLLNPIMIFAEVRLIPFLKKHIQKEKSCQTLARSLSICFALLMGSLAIYILARIILPQLLVSIHGLLQSLPELSESFIVWVTTILSENPNYGPFLEDLIINAMELAENWIKADLLPELNTWISAFATGVIGILSLVSDFLIGIMVSIYILGSKEKFASQGKMLFYAIFKPNTANIILELLRESHLIFGGFIIGKIIDSTIIGILCFIGCSLLQMPYTLLISLFIGITNIIPFFGPFIGAIPSAILILFVNPIQCVYFILFILVLQQLDGNVIGPAILSDHTGLSAFWIVTSTTLAGGLFGIFGMVIGVPTCAIIIYIIRRFSSYLLCKKNMPSNSCDYKKIEKIISNEDGSMQYMERITTVEKKMKKREEKKEQQQNKTTNSNNKLK